MIDHSIKLWKYLSILKVRLIVQRFQELCNVQFPLCWHSDLGRYIIWKVKTRNRGMSSKNTLCLFASLYPTLYEGADPSAVLSEFRHLPISASFDVKRVLGYSLRNIPSYQNLISTRQRLGKIKDWIRFSPWIFFYIIDFFINLQITTEWECAFRNAAILIFCLIDSLNIPHSNQNPSFCPVEHSHFSDISSCCS